MAGLLWAGQGVSADNDKRTAPSAGKLYPLYTYVLIRAVAELPRGIYRYDAESHTLKFVDKVPQNETLSSTALDEQPWLDSCAAVVVIGGDFNSARERFRAQPPVGDRGARYVYIEAGAVSQNIHLQASLLELGLVMVAGFDDAKVRRFLKLPDYVEPIVLLAIGKWK
jgi:SagB-type dehydrogenase family enzyme